METLLSSITDLDSPKAERERYRRYHSEPHDGEDAELWADALAVALFGPRDW